MHATVLILTGFAGLAALLTITDLRAVKPGRARGERRERPHGDDAKGDDGGGGRSVP